METMKHMMVAKHRVLIVGLGLTGLSCARYLSAHGIEVAVTDSREKPPGLEMLREELPDVAVFTGSFDKRVFASADELIVSPGVSLKHPLIKQAIDAGKKVLGDVELFAQQAKAPVMVVTGSNGKSTVTSLLGIMARESGLDARVGGNIGKPVLDLLTEQEPDCYILELSSFQLEYTQSLNAQVATVLNISEDHMDRYDSLNEYIEAKQRAFRGSGALVLNRDDVEVMKLAQPVRKIITFGLDEPEQNDYGIRRVEGEVLLCRGDAVLLGSHELLIPGLHNVANALAALAMGEAAGFAQSAMLRALRGFKGLAHRSQFVTEYNGVRWYNDSKATNVGATAAALKGLDGPVVLIAGGEGKGADFSDLELPVRQKARAVILIGTDAEKIAQVLNDSVQIEYATDMQHAVNLANKLAKRGDSVLLSPACASFDMFRNFEHRGEVFMDCVRSLQ